MSSFSHEEPILLVLPPDQALERALPAFVGHPEVRHHQLPPLWALDRAGIDLPAALPGVASVTRETLGEVVAALLRLCSAERLDALVARAWREADERVRQHHLELGMGQTFAVIFKLGVPTVERPPARSFRRDRIHEHGFEIQYRLAAPETTRDVRAPDHEASLIWYPFDPANEEARSEFGLGEGRGAVLEVFAYERAREQHRDFLAGVAAQNGWDLVDPRLSA
jgi:hypothetical protein